MVILVVALLAFLSFTVLFENVAQAVLERFTAKDLGTGRGDLFRRYNNVIIQSPSNFLFGIGMQGILVKTRIWNSPHNGLQEIMVCWGLCGMILMTIFGINVYRRISRYANRKPAVCYYFPLVVFFAIIQTMQFIRLPAIFNLMIPLFIAAYMGGLQAPEVTALKQQKVR